MPFWPGLKNWVGDFFHSVSHRRSDPNGAAKDGKPFNGAAPDSKTAIAGIERRIWNLVLLAIAVILYLTLSLVGMQVMGVIEIALPEADGFPSALMFPMFLGVLVLLFSAYLIIQQRQLLNTTKKLFQEQQAAGELSRNVDILKALLDVSSNINIKRHLGVVLRTIARAVRRAFHADRVSIMLINGSGKTIKTIAVDGRAVEKTKDALVPLGEGVAGWVVANGEPLLLQGQVDPGAFPGFRANRREVSSAMCVPLKIGRRCVGVLNVNLIGRRLGFTDNDLQLISIFANNVATSISNALLLRRREEQLKLKTVVERLHSPQVVHELIQKTGSLREKRTICTLFADIRGFSEMIAELEPEQMMTFLDAFYERMARTVADNDGVLDKFMGDEAMVFFGAPEPLENVSRSALETAMQMMIFFGMLRDRFGQQEPRFKRVGLGIGINTGTVVVGSVGSRQRAEYTVIGDAVNLARRLCSHALPGEILVGEATRDQIQNEIVCQFVDNVHFKGAAMARPVYRVDWEVHA